MKALSRTIIRISSFVSKEITEVLRQPLLVLTLVLGPFLILLLFGLGYRNEARPLRTLFVAPANSAIRQQIEQYATSLGPQLLFSGVTESEEVAQQRLRDNLVDVVVVAPSDAEEKILNSQPALFTLYHNEVNPLEVDYVNVFGRVYVDEVNRLVLRSLVEGSQEEVTTVQEELESARENVRVLRQAAEQGDQLLAQQRAQSLSQDLTALDLAVGASAQLLGSVQQTVGLGQESPLTDAGALLSGLQQKTSALEDAENVDANTSSQQLSEIEADLDELETTLAEFQRIDADVLVRPFRSETNSLTPVQLRVTDYYAPAVIVLLLQHLCVTLGALSIVRERLSGALELFRVSPLSAFEMLLGKYLSYIIFAGVLAFILALVLVYTLGVPMLGTWQVYIGAVLGLIFASLGFGFLISLLAQTTTQAVQYSMLMLLASVFFTGAFLSLDALWAPVRIISWILPATYGIQLLQDIMLRGSSSNLFMVLSLTAIGLALMLLSWLLLRRRMATN